MKENRKIIHILAVMSILFFVLVGYLTYFQLVKGPKMISSAYNRRQLIAEDKTLRGSILDKNGTVLANSERTGDTQVRKYPYGSLYSQVIGYNSRVYGRSLLELSYNSYLMGTDEYTKVFGLFNKIGTDEKQGNDVYLTLDHKIQSLAEKQLAGKNGAIVAMNPKTGEIIALASKPDFNPDSESLKDNWRNLVESQDSPFLPRATQGLYVPGSTFKVLTSALAVENGIDKTQFEDQGTITIDGKQIGNYGGGAYGNMDVAGALTVSSNVVFSQLGVKLGENAFKDITARIGMGKEIPFDLLVSKSIFPYKSMGKTDLAAVGMGQGKLLLTPLHMAMVASSIANHGTMMKPILVSKVTTPNGNIVKSNNPSALYRVMKEDTADKVAKMMQKVVEAGTGANAAIPGIHVAGKTGTAENELTGKQKNKEHAWFISFAPVEDPQIAVAVVIEYGGGSGGTTAAPIAQKIMAEYLKK